MGDFSKSEAFASLLRFSHLSRVFRAGAHFSALDGQQLLVVEGSGWRGRRESDSQAFCRPNSMQALIHMVKHMGQVARQNHNHHNHHTPRKASPRVFVQAGCSPPGGDQRHEPKRVASCIDGCTRRSCRRLYCASRQWHVQGSFYW